MVLLEDVGVLMKGVDDGNVEEKDDVQDEEEEKEE